MSLKDEDLDQRLATTAAERADHVSDSALDDLFARTRAHARSNRKRRLGVAAIIGTFAVIGGVVAGPAAADEVRKFFAQTGIIDKTGGEAAEGSEWVRTEATDFYDLQLSLYPEYLSLPDGVAREDIVLAAIGARPGPEDVREPGVLQDIGIQYSYEVAARCSWVAEWARAYSAKDDAAMTRAADELRLAADWPAMQALNGGGVAEYVRAAADSAASFDLQSFRASTVGAECASDLRAGLAE